jgi:hypothetical protein
VLLAAMMVMLVWLRRIRRRSVHAAAPADAASPGARDC